MSASRRVFAVRRGSVAMLQSVALVLLSASLVVAQSFTATVRGTAKDASGSAVPRAAITITDANRGTSQTTVADGDGRFVIAALQPGEYLSLIHI